MRVIHLDLERGWRGGQRQLELLVRELAAHGLHQTLLCRAGSEVQRRFEDSGRCRVEIVGVRGRSSALLAARRARRDGQATIVHAHTGGTAPLSVLATAGSRAVSVITRRLDLPVFPWFFRRADRVVAISGRVREVLAAAGVADERLTVIPSGIDLGRELDPRCREALRRRVAAATGREPATVGLTVAALVPQKDPLTLVEALVDLPGDHVHVWVGDGDLDESVKRRAASLGVADRLYLTGFEPNPDPWFAAADVFVLPSVHEGLGTVLLDAFHFGVPVVGSAIAATSSLLEDGVSARTFEPGDAGRLARGVKDLLRSSRLRDSLVDEGRRRVAGYDARAVGAAYRKLYEELASERPR